MQVYATVYPPSLEAVPGLARLAERLGCDGIHFTELKVDAILASLLASEHTSHLQVGTAIAVAFPRSPMITAQAAWNIQRLAGGRFRLGLGTQVKGHIERRFSVPWDSPGPRLREYVLALRAIWDRWQRGTPLAFKGKFYSFSLMTPEFDPGPLDCPPPRVLISAVNPYNLRLAGEVCDGVLLHPLCSVKYAKEVVLPTVAEGARIAGRDPGDVAICGGGFIITAPDPATLANAVEEARARISFYASTRSYLPVMEIHGWGDVAKRLFELSVRGAWSEMPSLITDEMLDTFAVVGTYAELADRVRARYQGWASQVDLPLSAPDTEDEAGLATAIRAMQTG